MSFISASSTILLLVLSVVVQHAAAESFIGKAVDTGKFNILNAALAEYDITGLLVSVKMIVNQFFLIKIGDLSAAIANTCLLVAILKIMSE